MEVANPSAERKKRHHEMHSGSSGLRKSKLVLFLSYGFLTHDLWSFVEPSFTSCPEVLCIIVHSYHVYLNWSEWVSAPYKHSSDAQDTMFQGRCSCCHRPLSRLRITRHFLPFLDVDLAILCMLYQHTEFLNAIVYQIQGTFGF